MCKINWNSHAAFNGKRIMYYHLHLRICFILLKKTSSSESKAYIYIHIVIKRLYFSNFDTFVRHVQYRYLKTAMCKNKGKILFNVRNLKIYTILDSAIDIHTFISTLIFRCQYAADSYHAKFKYSFNIFRYHALLYINCSMISHNVLTHKRFLSHLNWME